MADAADHRQAAWSAWDNFKGLAPVMPAQEVWQMIREKKPLVIVDVRTADEQSVSTLPGPVVTKEQFEAGKSQHPKDTPVVCYCTLGARSGKYAASLVKEGFDARNLEASILGWTHEGLPLVKPGGEHETKQVHVFAKQFALQAPDYEAVTGFSSSASSAQSGMLGWAFAKYSAYRDWIRGSKK